MRYVVVLPDGRAFYSDSHGRIGANATGNDVQAALALVGGALGFLLGEGMGAGGAGAIAGALVGAFAGHELSKKRAA